MGLLIPIAGAVVVLVIIVACCCRRRSKPAGTIDFETGNLPNPPLYRPADD
jgi:hypothetical protein